MTKTGRQDYFYSKVKIGKVLTANIDKNKQSLTIILH